VSEIGACCLTPHRLSNYCSCHQLESRSAICWAVAVDETSGAEMNDCCTISCQRNKIRFIDDEQLCGGGSVRYYGQWTSACGKDAAAAAGASGAASGVVPKHLSVVSVTLLARGWTHTGSVQWRHSALRCFSFVSLHLSLSLFLLLMLVMLQSAASAARCVAIVYGRRYTTDI